MQKLQQPHYCYHWRRHIRPVSAACVRVRVPVLRLWLVFCVLLPAGSCVSGNAGAMASSVASCMARGEASSLARGMSIGTWSRGWPAVNPALSGRRATAVLTTVRMRPAVLHEHWFQATERTDLRPTTTAGLRSIPAGLHAPTPRVDRRRRVDKASRCCNRRGLRQETDTPREILA